MEKLKWEIWVKGNTYEGNIDKCVALFEETAQRAVLHLRYAEECYPECVVALKTTSKAGDRLALDSRRGVAVRLVAVGS